MAISFVGSTTAHGDVTELVLNKPTGVTSGDLLFAAFRFSSTNTSFAAPSGWTLLRSDDGPRIFYRVAGSSEPASYTFTVSSSGSNIAGAMLAYRGANLGGHAAQANPDGTIIAPSLTTSRANNWLMCVFAQTTDTNGTYDFSTPAGMTERCEVFRTSGTGYHLMVADELRPSTGATGTRTSSSGWNESSSVGQSVELVAINDLPAVTVAAPLAGSSVTTGGPNLTVSWNYSQAQGVAQAKYRVRITNDADTLTYHDTSLLAGSDGSKVFDLVALGVPTDSTDVSVRITVESADGPTFQASATSAFNMEWGVPTTTITAPVDGAQLTSPSLSTAWLFSSTRSKTQSAFRVRVGPEGGSAFYDSGWVLGTAGSLAPSGLVLADNSRLFVEVKTKNSEGVVSA